MLDPFIHKTFEEQNGFPLAPSLMAAFRVGSQSHGTFDPQPDSIDDEDTMIVVLPPAERLLGFRKFENWVMQIDRFDVVCYSLEKYLSLLLKSNPNVLGTLYLRPEDYLFVRQDFAYLLEMRTKLASQHAYPAFCGYAYAQLKRLESTTQPKYRGYMGQKRKALVDKFGYDPKNASHLIRLWRMGLEFIQTGEMRVYRPDREELKAIKRGEWPLGKILDHAAYLKELMPQALAQSPLPKEPDMAAVEAYLVSTSYVALRTELD